MTLRSARLRQLGLRRIQTPVSVKAEAAPPEAEATIHRGGVLGLLRDDEPERKRRRRQKDEEELLVALT